MIEFTTADILLVILVLAGILVLQFYRGRKINLALQERVIKELESVFKPLDKIYQIIGVYVGFRGVIKVDNPSIDRVEVTTILMPRHSLLYYPISLLTVRMDKVMIHLVPRGRIPGEAHVVRRGYYRLGSSRVIEGSELMRSWEEEIGGTKFEVFDSSNLSGHLLEVVRSLPDPGLVNHLALVPENNTIFFAFRLKPESLRENLEALKVLAEHLFPP